MSGQGCIAWIEDDIDVLDSLMNPLRKQGFEIREYRTYAEAIEGLDEIQECRLICLDLILPPGRDVHVSNRNEYLGMTLLRDLRTKFSVTAPILVLSVVADGPDVDQDKLKALDAVPLAKPVHLHELKREVDEMLGLESL